MLAASEIRADSAVGLGKFILKLLTLVPYTEKIR
jgi:hypothetical protein